MAIERDVEVVVCTGVNKANEMLLARRKGLEVIRTATAANHLAVDENGISSRRTAGTLGGGSDLEEGAMVPIGERNGTEINVVVGGSRTCLV